MPNHPADRAQQLRQVFGDVLPEATTDDRFDPADAADATDAAVDPAQNARDRWLRDNRPPHHDAP